MVYKKLKRFTLPVFIGIASFYISAMFLLGVLAGYILMRYFSGKIGSIKFSFAGYRIHLHHWVCSSAALLAIFISGIYSSLPALLLGVGGGIVFHGIYCYNDWYKIISKNKVNYPGP